MTSHRRITFVILSLVLSLGACEQGSTGTDTGPAATDTGGVGETDTGTPIDAPVAVDAPLAIDAPSATDAPAVPSDDAFVVADDATPPGESDAGFRGDAGSIGAGECDMRAECPPTCFRAVTCVKECGGPETECGCCPCAPGSIDAITCGTAG
jgi:hypothetical protein